MTSIIFLGEFREFNDGPTAPSIRNALGVVEPSHRDLVATYLEGGIAVTAVPGLEHDALDGTLIRQTLSYLTDGRYIWHEVLAHYVRKYGVRLDSKFVDMVLGGAVPPTSLEDESDAAVSRWLHDDYERRVSRNKKP